jgi:hypothetical protein
MVVAADLAVLGSCSRMGIGPGLPVLCRSSIRFTLEVLNLVLMVGARDGKMRGEGESSPEIAGMGKEVGTADLLALRAEVGSAVRVVGVTLYSSMRDSMSLLCCVSGWVLALWSACPEDSYWFYISCYPWLRQRGILWLGSWCCRWVVVWAYVVWILFLVYIVVLPSGRRAFAMSCCLVGCCTAAVPCLLVVCVRW